MKLRTLPLLLVFLAAGLAPSCAAAQETQSAAAAGNEPALLNGGFEQTGEQGHAAHWEPLVTGAPAKFALDEAEKHSGKRSGRLMASEVTRSYFGSNWMPVAPGEKIHVSAWVKHQDVPPGQGTVILIAEFSDARHRNERVAKVDTADTSKPSPQWRKIAGVVTAPPLAAHMRLRAGFSYSKGTCWWDDIVVEPDQPLVARIDLASAIVSPAREGFPVMILNRKGETGPVRVRLMAGKIAATADAKLSGEPMQRVNVPIELTTRGKLQVEAALLRPGREEPVYSENRDITIPPPLVLLPPIPTHWAVEDGPAKIELTVEVAVPQKALTGASLAVTLVDSAGKAHAATEVQTPRDGANPITLTPQPLPEGNYSIVAELKPANKAGLMRVEQPWGVIPRRLARVTLTPDGFPTFDGKTIFPLGMFNGGAKMKEMGAAGFTVTHAYNSVEAVLGERQDDQRAKDFLDSTHANGMRAVMLIPRKLAFHDDWDGVRRRIRMFRNHPGLLTWDEEEGIARGDIKLDVLKKLYAIVKEEDPNHPMMVGDARDVIGRIPGERRDLFPVDAMDLGMWWWYPFPLGGATTASALEGDEGPRGLELVPPSFLVNAETEKPIWVGVQSYKKPQPWARYPNPLEYRAQAYVALIHGAKGLMWYGGSVTGGLFGKPDEGHWDYLQQLARELRELSPVLLGETLATPTIEPADAPVSVALKRGGNRTILMAANRGNRPLDVTITSSALGNSSVTVLTEDREIGISGGAIRDHFGPYAVHVYEIK
jgi:hypothetical protein